MEWIQQNQVYVLMIGPVVFLLLFCAFAYMRHQRDKARKHSEDLIKFFTYFVDSFAVGDGDSKPLPLIEEKANKLGLDYYAFYAKREEYFSLNRLFTVAESRLNSIGEELSAEKGLTKEKDILLEKWQEKIQELSNKVMNLEKLEAMTQGLVEIEVQHYGQRGERAAFYCPKFLANGLIGDLPMKELVLAGVCSEETGSEIAFFEPMNDGGHVLIVKLPEGAKLNDLGKVEASVDSQDPGMDTQQDVTASETEN